MGATKRMLNTTANKTAAPVQTEWVINMMVQPDPFAVKADNDATVKAATGTSAIAALDTVTKATYGAMTAKAVAITEVAVKWVKAPSATGGAKQVTVAGSTDVGVMSTVVSLELHPDLECLTLPLTLLTLPPNQLLPLLPRKLSTSNPLPLLLSTSSKDSRPRPVPSPSLLSSLVLTKEPLTLGCVRPLLYPQSTQLSELP